MDVPRRVYGFYRIGFVAIRLIECSPPGATIASELEDMFWGDRTYVAEDPEGHRWTFAEHTRDVPPEEMTPPA